MKLVPFLVVLLLISSCSNKDDIPQNVLPQKKMQQLLWDVMRADELVTYSITADSSINHFAKSTELYSRIFNLHKTTNEVFVRSLTFYQNHPHLLQPILDSLQSQSSRVDTTAASYKAVP